MPPEQTAPQMNGQPALPRFPIPQRAPATPVTTPAAPASSPATTSQTSGGGTTISPVVANLARAIRQVESGGNYNAQGKSGEYGAFQFTNDTWNAAAPKYGVTSSLKNATATEQNKVALGTLQDWYNENPTWNVGNFASAWNAGKGAPNAYLGNAGTNKEGVNYDTRAYAKQVATAYQSFKNGQGNPSAQTNPTAPSAPTNPNATPDQNPAPQKDFLSSASDLLNTLFPNKNIGEAVGTGLDALFPNTFIPKAVAPSASGSPTLSGASQVGNIAPSSATVGNVTGDLLGDAAWLVGGGEAAPAVEEASQLGRIVPAALQGAKAGAIAGGLGGAGNALSNNGTLGDAAIGGVEGALGGAATGGILGGGLAALPGVAGRVANFGIQSESNVANEATRGALGNDNPLNASNFAKNANNFQKNAQASEDVIGKITQASSPEDRAVAQSAFQDVDTSGKIKDYPTLISRVQDAIDKNQSVVDKAHSSNTAPVKLNNLGQKISAGVGNTKLTRTVNYVKDGLNQLKDFYNKTGDTENELRISSLIKKGNTTGLTSTDINNIAREHGRVLNGYNANGELASGLKKQAAENTRTGIKNTARSFLSSDAAKVADQKTSQLINLKGQLQDVQKGINNLSNKVEKRGIIKKIAGALGQGIDIATLGAPKAFFQKLFLESNVGNKSGNYLDFQSRLSRNLAILNRLNGSTDTDVEKFLRNVIGGLVKRR